MEETPVLLMSPEAPMETEDLLDHIWSFDNGDWPMMARLGQARQYGSLVAGIDDVEQELLKDATGTRLTHFIIAAFWDRSIRPLAGSDIRGLFPGVSFIKHSCHANAEAVWHGEKNQMAVRAIVDVQKGQEITVSYTDPYDTKAKRHEALGFQCYCKICKYTGKEAARQDELRGQVHKALAMVADFSEQYRSIIDAGPDWSEKNGGEIMRAVGTPKYETMKKIVVRAMESCAKEEGGLDLWHSRIATLLQVPCWVAAAHFALDEQPDERLIESCRSGLEILATGLGIQHPRTQEMIHWMKFLLEDPDDEVFASLVRKLTVAGEQR